MSPSPRSGTRTPSAPPRSHGRHPRRSPASSAAAQSPTLQTIPAAAALAKKSRSQSPTSSAQPQAEPPASVVPPQPVHPPPPPHPSIDKNNTSSSTPSSEQSSPARGRIHPLSCWTLRTKERFLKPQKPAPDLFVPPPQRVPHPSRSFTARRVGTTKAEAPVPPPKPRAPSCRHLSGGKAGNHDSPFHHDSQEPKRTAPSPPPPTTYQTHPAPARTESASVPSYPEPSSAHPLPAAQADRT